MSREIPFFELFPTLELPWELRASLGEAYLTAVEVERQRRERPRRRGGSRMGTAGIM